MIYLLFLISFIRATSSFCAMDMTPVSWPMGLAPGPNNIRETIQTYRFTTVGEPVKKLTAILPEGSILDVLEEQIEAGDINDRFMDIKAKRFANLVNWFAHIPLDKTGKKSKVNAVIEFAYTGKNPDPSTSFRMNKDDDMRLLGYTGRTPQTNYNTDIIDRIVNGKFEDSRRPVESTLEKAFRPQGLLKYKSRTSDEELGHASAFLFAKNAAITSAHCIYKHDKYEIDPSTGNLVLTKPAGWATNDFIFYPAYNNGHAPLKGYKPRQIFIPQCWINANNISGLAKYYGDFAVMVFDENIAEFTGSLGLISVDNVISNLTHPLNHHVAQVGGYPGTLGTCGEDKIGKNKKKQGIELVKPQYFASIYNIRKIVDGRLIKHLMDVTPGQSGGAIMPHIEGVFDYQKEPYAIGITSHGNSKKNRGVLITEEILRWALGVLEPYRIAGRSAYTLTFPEVFDSAKRHIDYANDILRVNANNPALKKYIDRWTNILWRIAKKTAVLDQDRALTIHRYGSENFRSNISGYYTGLQLEKELEFTEARAIYQRTYAYLVHIFNLEEGKLKGNLDNLKRIIFPESKETLFRLGNYYLRGLGGDVNTHKAHWLFCLAKYLEHPQATEAFETIKSICQDRKTTFEIVAEALFIGPFDLGTMLLRPKLIYHTFGWNDASDVYNFWEKGCPLTSDISVTTPFINYIRQHIGEYGNQTPGLLARLDRLTNIPMNHGYDNFYKNVDTDIFTNAPDFFGPAPAPAAPNLAD